MVNCGYLWVFQSFVVPADVLEVYRRPKVAEQEWNQLFQAYSAAHPELAAEYQRRLEGHLPSSWHEGLPRFAVEQV